MRIRYQPTLLAGLKRADLCGTPCVLEPPVIGNSEANVPSALVPSVLPVGAVGCYLRDEVGLLALLSDDLAVAVW